MTNRIQHLFDERAESPRDIEYFVVAGEFGQVFVSRETARRLRTIVSRIVPPRWIDIRSLFGTTLRVRTRTILTIAESTVGQRAAARQFWRELDAEETNDRRPWDPD